MYPLFEHRDCYTFHSLRRLESLQPDKQLIVEYRHTCGDMLSGYVTNVYHSITGAECVCINNFANAIHCADVTGHKFI